MRVEVIETSELGDRSYVVSDGAVAVVIDPQRDVDRVEDLVAQLGVRVQLVLETHIHNDYVTGGMALAQRTGAAYVVSGQDDVAFERHPVHDGDELTAGSLRIRVLSTPGHTATHLAYTIGDGTGSEAVFTGGSLLYGSVGRTDLLGMELTDTLTRQQWHSARRLAAELPDDTAVYPTHGFGSFCSSGAASAGTDSTIGQEKQRNDALTGPGEQAFVDALVAGLTAYPAYYAHMGPRNAAGPQAPDLSPPDTMQPDELARRIRAGQWVVDLRDRSAYAGRHLAGTASIAVGESFSTYVGWLVPWGAPLTLLGESPEQVAAAQRQLVRIGVDRLEGATAGELDSLGAGTPTRSYRVVSFPDLVDADATVLDVRRDDERAAGFIQGSHHVPLHQLLDRLDELPGGTLWVHCASGLRAGIAASLLDRAGRDVVHVDDDFTDAEAAGLTLVRPRELR